MLTVLKYHVHALAGRGRRHHVEKLHDVIVLEHFQILDFADGRDGKLRAGLAWEKMKVRDTDVKKMRAWVWTMAYPLLFLLHAYLLQSHAPPVWRFRCKDEPEGRKTARVSERILQLPAHDARSHWKPNPPKCAFPNLAIALTLVQFHSARLPWLRFALHPAEPRRASRSRTGVARPPSVPGRPLRRKNQIFNRKSKNFK